MRRKRYLVLGGTGFLGTNLIKDLREQNCEAISFSRALEPTVVGTKHISGDLQDRNVIPKLLQLHPDVIVSFVGFSGQVTTNKYPDKSFSINVLSHYQLLQELAKTSGIKFVFSSSRLEYGKPKYLPVDEAHSVAPLSYYGLHKHLVTEYNLFLSRTSSLDVTVLRTSNPYGPNLVSSQGYNLINFWVRQAMQDKKLVVYGDGAQERDYLYIDDFLKAIKIVAEHPQSKGQIYNLGSGTGVSLREAAETIISILGGGKVVYKSWPEDVANVETGSYVSNISKMKALDWQPQFNFAQGIAQMIKKI